MDRAGRAVVPCIEPPMVSRLFRASIVPSRCSSDVFGPTRGAGPARWACLQGSGCAAHPRRAGLGAPV